MASSIRISEKLLNDVRKFSRIDHRSLAGQIEHWARLGKCVEENPDLTFALIKEILIGLAELDQGGKPNTDLVRLSCEYTSPVHLREKLTSVPTLLEQKQLIVGNRKSVKPRSMM